MSAQYRFNLWWLPVIIAYHIYLVMWGREVNVDYMPLEDQFYIPFEWYWRQTVSGTLLAFLWFANLYFASNNEQSKAHWVLLALAAFLAGLLPFFIGTIVGMGACILWFFLGYEESFPPIEAHYRRIANWVQHKKDVRFRI